MVDIPLLKQRVLNFLSQNGPAVPVRLSGVLGSDSFFAGAILSELIAEKKVKISTAKLGRSPVYYLPGQEPQLSIVYPHLPDKEKEAYNFLKEKKLVKDAEAIPSIRVAFRMMKDFAIPVVLKTSAGEELYWKWHLATDEETRTVQLIEVPIEKPQVMQEPQQIQQTLAPVKKPRQLKPDEFSSVVHSFLTKNNLTLVEQQVVRKNQEINCVIKVPSSIGDIEMLVIAKNKKTIGDADLTLAHQKGMNRKLPILLLTSGELTKKAQSYMEKNLKGYIILRKFP